jgi:hypothetical protein
MIMFGGRPLNAPSNTLMKGGVSIPGIGGKLDKEPNETFAEKRNRPIGPAALFGLKSSITEKRNRPVGPAALFGLKSSIAEKISPLDGEDGQELQHRAYGFGSPSFGQGSTPRTEREDASRREREDASRLEQQERENAIVEQLRIKQQEREEVSRKEHIRQ